MESNQERVLAYQLARVIEHDELGEVSGGSHMCSHMTMRPSGAGGLQDVDGTLDVSVDW